MIEEREVNVEKWIEEEVEEEFEEKEGEELVRGDGVKKKSGLMRYEKVEDDEWEWGKIGNVEKGVEGEMKKEDK